MLPNWIRRKKDQNATSRGINSRHDGSSRQQESSGEKVACALRRPEGRLLLSVSPVLANPPNLPAASYAAPIPSAARNSVSHAVAASTLTTSSNWSGYAAETSLANPSSNAVTSVSGTWQVPTVTGSGKGTTYSSVWVGIDGYSSSTVEQIGTEEDVSGGKASYYAWYEMYPNASVTLTSVSINPGDQISAEVQYETSGQFALSITDVTSRVSDTVYSAAPQTRRGTVAAQRSSAEWIVEAPSSGSGVLPLADFGQVTFTNASATIGTTTGPIDDSAWQFAQINMVSRSATEASTSTLTDSTTSPATSSFVDAYGSVTPNAPAPAVTTAPSGYTITADNSTINAVQAQSTGFTFAGAGVGDKYNYTVTDINGTTVSGNGLVTSATQDVTEINVSKLANGQLTFSVTLTNSAGTGPVEIALPKPSLDQVRPPSIRSRPIISRSAARRRPIRPVSHLPGPRWATPTSTR